MQLTNNNNINNKTDQTLNLRHHLKVPLFPVHNQFLYNYNHKINQINYLLIHKILNKI